MSEIAVYTSFVLQKWHICNTHLSHKYKTKDHIDVFKKKSLVPHFIPTIYFPHTITYNHILSASSTTMYAV